MNGPLLTETVVKDDGLWHNKCSACGDIGKFPTDTQAARAMDAHYIAAHGGTR